MLLPQGAGLWVAVEGREERDDGVRVDGLAVLGELLRRPMERGSRTQVADLPSPTMLAWMYAWAASRIIRFHPRRAPTAKVARTDAIAAGAEDTSWNNPCGATPEPV